MSGIYVPIDYSDLKNIIPPGEDIVYSTLAKGNTSQIIGTKTRTWKWISHILMTPNGVAFTFPDKRKKKAPPLKIYKTWDEIYSIISGGRLGAAFSISKSEHFTFVRDENFETKEKFRERCKEFVTKFRPLLIKKKEEWVELNHNNPEIKPKRIKRMENSIKMLKDKENKRIAKEAKKS